MFFSIFYTDVPLPQEQLPDFSRLMPIVCETRDEAIGKSCKLIANNAIVWKIEGPNNLLINRADIEDACLGYKHSL